MSELEFDKLDQSEKTKDDEFNNRKEPLKSKDLDQKSIWLYPEKLVQKVMRDLSANEKVTMYEKAEKLKKQYHWPIKYAKVLALGFRYDDLYNCFVHKRNLLKTKKK